MVTPVVTVHCSIVVFVSQTITCIQEETAQVLQNANCHSFTRRNFSLVFSVLTPATVVRVTRTLTYRSFV
jgi:hypothetical protein